MRETPQLHDNNIESTSQRILKEQHQQSYRPTIQEAQAPTPQLEARINNLERKFMKSFSQIVGTAELTTKLLGELFHNMQQIDTRVDRCLGETRDIKIVLKGIYKMILKWNKEEKQCAEEDISGSTKDEEEYLTAEDTQVFHQTQGNRDQEDVESSRERGRIELVDQPTIWSTDLVDVAPTRSKNGEKRARKRKRKIAEAAVAKAIEHNELLRYTPDVYVYLGEPGRGVNSAFDHAFKCTVGDGQNAKCLLAAAYKINIMSATFANIFGVPEHAEILFSIKDGTIRYPEGVLYNIPVQFDNQKFHTNFIVYKFEREPPFPIILGQPFLSSQEEAMRKKDNQHTCVDESPPE